MDDSLIDDGYTGISMDLKIDFNYLIVFVKDQNQIYSYNLFLFEIQYK